MKRYIIQKEESIVHLTIPNAKGNPDKYLVIAVFMFKVQALAFIKNEKLEGFNIITINI